MGEHHPLTDFQKGQILALASSCSQQEIHEKLSIPCSTISDFLQRFRRRQSIENLSHPGRPRKTTNRTDRLIIRTALTHPRLPLRDITDHDLINVSDQTIRRRLREEGIRKWHAVNRPLLTPKHARDRRRWAI